MYCAPLRGIGGPLVHLVLQESLGLMALLVTEEMMEKMGLRVLMETEVNKALLDFLDSQVLMD